MNFLDDDDGPEDNVLTINKNYAERYDKWRKGEELQKLKDKYGNNFEEESSSTSEDEDEDAVELTEKIEKDFFKTLSSLKEKDPKIYDENVRFFEEKAVEDEKIKKVKAKPVETLTMAAYQRQVLLETNGIIEEEHPTNNEDLPLVEQEKLIKNSFKNALKDLDSDDDDVGGLFKTKIKTVEEIKKEDDNYKSWLAGQKAAVPKDEEKELKGLRDYWNDPKLDEGEKFLRDYMLNQRYLENDTAEPYQLDLSDSEDEAIEKQEEFERKFNFRFEEPDQDFIKRYPRTVEQSMRQKDDKRKKQRDALKTRKQAERAQKDEELKRLKTLKRAEILEKIKKLQEVTGNEDLTFKENDIDGDFNPEEHDKRMCELFDQEFYEDQVDEEKPEFPDIDEELEIENWDQWQGNAEEENIHCEDPDFVMDCDYDPKSATQEELLDNTKRRKKRRQSKFSAAVARPKPVFDPKSSSYEKYVDEYYSLNYEDLIGDIPCRFKYRKVLPNDFGLSIEEILSAPDKELNRWASVKKIMRRRPEHIEVYEQKAYKKKAANIKKKMQCIPSLYSNNSDDDDGNDTQTNHDESEKGKNNNISIGNSIQGINMKKDAAVKKKKSKKAVNSVSLNDSNKKSNLKISETHNIVKIKKGKNSLSDTTVNKSLDKSKLHTSESPPAVKKKKVKKAAGNISLTDSKTNTSETHTIIKKKKVKNAANDVSRNNSEGKSVITTSETHSAKKKKERKNTTNEITLNDSMEKSILNSFDVHATKKNSMNKRPNSSSPNDSHKSIPLKKAKLNKSNTNKSVLIHEKRTPTNINRKGSMLNRKFKLNGKAKLPKRSSGTKKAADDNPLTSLSDARLKSYGINPKKFKNKLKYGNK